MLALLERTISVSFSEARGLENQAGQSLDRVQPLLLREYNHGRAKVGANSSHIFLDIQVSFDVLGHSPTGVCHTEIEIQTS